jgi:hypothetical protein
LPVFVDAKYEILTVAKATNYTRLEKKKKSPVQTGHNEAESNGIARGFVQ